MYSTYMSRSIIINQHNLNSVFTQSKKNDFIKYTVMIRNLSKANLQNNFSETRNKLLSALESSSLLLHLRKCLPSIPKTLKEQSGNILRVWTHQCECVLAQRLRRGQQMFSLYTKIWEERALKDLINKMRQQLTKRSKELIFSAVGVTSAYNWEEHRIPLSEFTKPNVLKDLDYITVLFNETLICKCCNNRILVDKKLPHIEYCHCKDLTDCPRKPYDGWTPFIDREDLLVWRRQDPTGPFQYKMYGKYNDVTAIDFLNVQIDIKYRKAWDKSAIDLQIVDTDPDSKNNSDLVYWEMEWPRFFSNRDYVFKRRYHIDCDNNLLFMMSLSTNHPSVPEKSDKYRIKDYWSVMVIRPLTNNFKEKGIEFTLTYFDNPGISIPQSVNTWVSMRAMPDFLHQLRKATKKYHRFLEKTGHECPCTIEELVRQYKDEQKHNVDVDRQQGGKTADDAPSGTHADVRLLNEIFNMNVANDPSSGAAGEKTAKTEEETAFSIGVEHDEKIKSGDDESAAPQETNNIQTNTTDDVMLPNSTSPTNVENESRSFFRYFHPYYYLS